MSDESMNLSKYDKSHKEVDLKGTNELPVYSIGELNAALKSIVEEKFSYVRVRGEISGYKKAASGHLYMSLKDVDSNIDAVCWRGTADKIAEFLCEYVKSGARIINIEARGSSIEESIEAVSSISALLHKEFPKL